MTRTAPDKTIDQTQGTTDIPTRRWSAVALAAWRESTADNLSLISAGVAFYAFLAFVPLLTALVLSYGLIADPLTVVGHMKRLTTMMPGEAGAIIGDQLKSMTEANKSTTGLALILALGIALYSASKGAGAIITALNIAFEVKEQRGFIKRTLLSLVLTAGAVLALLVAILAISVLNLLEHLLPDLGGVGQLLLQLLSFLLAAGAVAVLLAVVYRYGPNRPDAEWRWITPGSALATLVWILATFGFGIYVSNFGDYGATYGSLGAVIVFVTWLYLTAYIVLFGAELNSTLELVNEAGEGARTEPSEPAPTDRPSPPPSEAAGRPGPRVTSSSPSMATILAKLGIASLALRLFGTRTTRMVR